MKFISTPGATVILPEKRGEEIGIASGKRSRPFDTTMKFQGQTLDVLGHT